MAFRQPEKTAGADLHPNGILYPNGMGNTVYPISIWRCCFKFLPSAIVLFGFGWLFWQVAKAEKRDVFFYGVIAFFWGLTAIDLALFLRILLGKPLLQTNPQGIVYGFQWKKEVRIAWQDILKIDWDAKNSICGAWITL